MIYGQDEAIAFPVADLYDSGIMQMYISAVRDQYQQGLKDYENFMSKYGDFISPFRKDVDMWNNEVMGPTMNLIDRMYAAGIDPTRNQEARAMIQQSMRNIPYSKVATARQNAKIGEEYIKARGALAAKGLYDKDYTDFWLAEQGYKPFEEWSAEDGAWNISSPIEYKDLFTATDPWFKNMKPHELTKQQVIDANYEYDPRYKYTGIPEEDLYQITGERIPGFMNSIEGRYYRNRVKRELEAAGVEPTEKAVNDELARRIVTANHAKVVDPTSDADEFAKLQQQMANQRALENLRTANNIREHEAKAQIDLKYDALGAGFDDNGDGKIDSNELKSYGIALRNSAKSGNGGGNNRLTTQNYNIFREAESKLGSSIGFKPENAHTAKIDPIKGAIQYVPGSGQDKTYYSIPGDQAEGIFFNHADVQNSKVTTPRGVRVGVWKDGQRLNNRDEYRFYPQGSIVAKKQSDGSYRYFISGKLRAVKFDNPDYDPKYDANEKNPKPDMPLLRNEKGGLTFEMEVTERDYYEYGNESKKK